MIQQALPVQNMPTDVFQLAASRQLGTPNKGVPTWRTARHGHRKKQHDVLFTRTTILHHWAVLPPSIAITCPVI
jgi:hypothetical protein